MKKIPWGILTGVLAMFVCWFTIAVIAAFMILNQIALQTQTTTTVFGTWWQTLLFVADILAAIGCFFCLSMFVLKKVKLNKIEEKETVKV